MQDKRSKKMVLLVHCILNQNSKVEGIARYPGTFRPAVDLILAKEVGIYQLPCPEMAYLGISRWSSVRDQYNSPFFKRHCRALAERVMDEMEDYARRGYRIAAMVGMDGSPSCGVDFSQEALGEAWGGRMNKLPERQYIRGTGTFIEVLKQVATERHLPEIPFIGFPENDQMGTVESALQKLDGILGQ
jgi:predicted secreted protein